MEELANNSTNIDNIPYANLEESFLSAKTLIAIVILLIYTIATPIFEKIHFHYIHESGICMILGLFVSLIATIINPTVNYFNYFIG